MLFCFILAICCVVLWCFILLGLKSIGSLSFSPIIFHFQILLHFRAPEETHNLFLQSFQFCMVQKKQGVSQQDLLFIDFLMATFAELKDIQN